MWRFLWQLTSAISHLHKHGIMHRDIKSANILFSGPRSAVKLCDFGVAHRFRHDGELLKGGSVGTPVYMAPEIVKEEAPTTHRAC